ncbi:hypothetical protein DAVIS_00603 [Mycobacterium marinum]|uniref:Uncharacterized protein n=1 Tax=Mycobacterium marinum TaxID=1781 RepID=A0A3E2N1Q9_MYCMR|nr:hypothetical protein DAVIS_00603 [Mycobacterium marinum]GJO56985.1 hypothetical protein NJB1604_49310 [Mycobacterium marinum]
MNSTSDGNLILNSKYCRCQCGWLSDLVLLVNVHRILATWAAVATRAVADNAGVSQCPLFRRPRVVAAIPIAVIRWAATDSTNCAARRKGLLAAGAIYDQRRTDTVTAAAERVAGRPGGAFNRR